MSVSNRILLLVLASLFAMTGLAGWMLIDRWTTSVQMRRLMTGCSVIETLTDLVGSLQKERGRSALFLSSKGAKNAPELEAQRLITDAKAKVFVVSVTDPAVRELGVDVLRQARDAEVAIRGLDDLRESVLHQSITLPNAIKSYSVIVSRVLDLSLLVARDTNHSEIKNFEFALSALQAASERAGLMRAVGAAGIAAGSFTSEQMYQITSLDAEGRDYLKSFTIYAPESSRHAYEARMKLPEAREIERLKALILATPTGQPVAGIDAEQWFREATNRVDLLRDVADGLLRTFMTRAEKTLSAATVELSVAALLVAMLVAVIVSFGLMTMRSISKLIGEMASAMRLLADGNLSITIPAISRTDEIGDMAKALVVFRAAAVEKTRLQVETDGERQRVTSVVADGLSRLAARDLSFRMDDAMPAAYAQLRADYNLALEQLEQAMLRVTGSVGLIHTGSKNITVAADSLAVRTEQQAANLEETATALDLITAAARKGADGVALVNDFAGRAKTEAERGGAIAQQATAAMQHIEVSSRQIGQIIQVIDSIARQTSLLALNAAVEAARAGESGRGFAVVANEVRALAKRSEAAAEDVKRLVLTSMKDVERGVILVNETGTALDRIVTQVAEITAVVAEIASGAKAQSGGLQELNASMRDIGTVTQRNTMMVEESTAASYALAEATVGLKTLIQSFKLSDDGVATSQLSTPSPRLVRYG